MFVLFSLLKVEKLGGECVARDVAHLQVHEARGPRQSVACAHTPAQVLARHSQSAQGEARPAQAQRQRQHARRFGQGEATYQQQQRLLFIPL